jgi:hypothetical protein
MNAIYEVMFSGKFKFWIIVATNRDFVNWHSKKLVNIST